MNARRDAPDRAGRRRVRRTAALLGCVAIAVYVGFIGLQFVRSHHG